MKRALMAMLAAGSIAACSSAPVYQGTASELIVGNYSAADSLLHVAGPQLDRSKPVIVATIVDIDDLDRSSTLGRMISENVSARFTQSGFRMVEMKFQKAVYMRRSEGELMLTREIREIAAAHQAQAVIVGTYSRGSRAVFVNLKVVRPESNIVLGAYDYSLRKNADVCSMIRIDPRDCED